jgi:hypothetical protein
MRTLGALCGLSFLFVARAAMATPFTVYDDTLSSSFSDKSIQVVPNYASTTNPYAGSDCISAQLGFGAEMIVASAGTPDISQYGGVDFWHRTSASTLTLIVSLRSSTQMVGTAVKVAVTSTWTNAHFTLADFGLNQNSGTIVGIDFSTSTVNVPQLALDQITLFDVTLDGGGPDASVSDGGSLDGGSLDASKTDASTSDASTSDASTQDSGGTDASGPPDAGSDASGADASPKPDASTKDAAATDDAGSEPVEITNGCSCDLAAPTSYASAIPLALVGLALIARRRRS